MTISGAKVQAMRHVAHMTQTDLAQRLGVHKNTVITWEKSSAVPARAELLLRQHFRAELAEVEAAMPDGPQEPTLSQASTLELLAELTKRAARETSGLIRDTAQLAVDPRGFDERARKEEAERRIHTRD